MLYHEAELRACNGGEGGGWSKTALRPAQPVIHKSSVKWKVLIMRQNIKEGQLNFRVFFHDFADSQRVPFYARIFA
jgi:hypothetical protein